MNRFTGLLLGALLLFGHLTMAQDPDLEGTLDEGPMDETVVIEEGTETLLLDNSRSKIGRDFYEAFFRHYAELPKNPARPAAAPTDSTRTITPNVELDPNAFIVAVDELPAFGIGTTIVSITLNDQIVWQNYVQARQDVIETYAFGAAELVNQYVLNYQEVQQGLVNEDQSGTGIF